MKRIRRTLLTLTAMLICLLAVTSTVHAKASYQNITTYGSDSKYTFKADMDGDGKKNTLVASLGKTNSSYKRNVTVKMDGKKVLSLKADNFYGIRIQYMNLSKKAQFLYLHGYGDSGMPSIQAVYQYKKSSKKLVKVLDLMNYLGTAGQVVKVSSNSITFSNGCGIPLTGRVKWNSTFVYKSGKFTLKSNTATVKYASTYQVGDGYDKYFAKSKYVASQSFSTYTGVSGTKVAYQVKKGEVLQMKKIKLYKDRLYFLFTNSSGKKGWLKGHQKGGYIGYLFYGVPNRLAGGFYG